MASSYSTDLKLELMVTGENSGTWGDKTNTNLNLLQQAIAGYQAIALTSTNTTLVMTNATISDARNAVIKFTGTIAANTTVFVDSGIEKTYIIENGTSGAFTLALNQVGGNSVIFGAADKTSKIVYLDGTNANDLGVVNLTAPQTLTNKTLTSPVINEIDDNAGNELVIFSKTTSAVNEFTITNSITGTAPEISATGGDTNIDIKITPKGTGKVNIDGIKYPNTDGSSGQLLSTDGSGNLSFITVSSEAQFIAGSLPLATNKSTTARTATSISKATGEVGAYPVLNVYSTDVKTVTTTTVMDYSLDGSRAIIIANPNATTWSMTGVFTPTNGTPVIGNTSVNISLGITPVGPFYQPQARAMPIDGDTFMFMLSQTDSTENASANIGCKAATMKVNTSGAITVGNVTGFQRFATYGPYQFPPITQLNQTTYLAGTDLFGVSTNLTTINRQVNTSASTSFYFTYGNYYNFGNIGETIYYPSNNTTIFTSINSTSRAIPASSSQSIGGNFYNNTATWYKVGDTRWIADYQNTTTLAREIATFNVNATTLAYTSINSTARLYSGMIRFIGTTTDLMSVSTNLTTMMLNTTAGIGFNQNTLELSTNGNILGYNVGTALGLAGVSATTFIRDVNDSTNVMVAFINTTNQYKTLKINAASTDQFNYCGIATSNDSTSPVTIIQDGIQGGYTGLLIGSTYYANFDGTLTTVATNITAGVAVTSTQLQVRQVNI